MNTMNENVYSAEQVPLLLYFKYILLITSNVKTTVASTTSDHNSSGVILL